MTYIDSSGRRVTTETAYLRPKVLKRSNLKVLVNAPVSRILFDTTGAKPKAIGVEFTSKTSNNSRTYRVRVKHEVIVAYVEALLFIFAIF